MLEGDGSYTVRGHVEIGKIERLFETELAADDFTTVAGLVITQLGHMPTGGEILIFRSLKFEIVESDERRVRDVRDGFEPEPGIAEASSSDAPTANQAE